MVGIDVLGENQNTVITYLDRRRNNDVSGRRTKLEGEAC